MAPAQSKLASKKRAYSSDSSHTDDEYGCAILDHPMRKIANGTAVFSDDYVNAMADGTMKCLPKKMDDIVVDVDSEKENRCTKKMKSYTPLDSQDVLLCPKYGNRDIFALFDDASYYSDGNVKHYNITCQGTDSSPCSFCISDEEKRTPSPKNQFVKPKGFNINDYEGEEDTPKKMPAGVPVCKWCNLAPCILENEETRDEGECIVDHLNEEVNEGKDVPLRNYRHALYRMYARRLGYKGKGVRVLLPVCVQAYVDKHFVEEGEVRTGFKDSK